MNPSPLAQMVVSAVPQMEEMSASAPESELFAVLDLRRAIEHHRQTVFFGQLVLVGRAVLPAPTVRCLLHGVPLREGVGGAPVGGESSFDVLLGPAVRGEFKGLPGGDGRNGRPPSNTAFHGDGSAFPGR